MGKLLAIFMVLIVVVLTIVPSLVDAKLVILVSVSCGGALFGIGFLLSACGRLTWAVMVIALMALGAYIADLLANGNLKLVLAGTAISLFLGMALAICTIPEKELFEPTTH